uniref:TGF_BETA_2 domain-containing protein n=1 Tax=Brugia timori TaxID=42155 RepID=A0A0R3R3Y8_9BILA
MNKFCSTPVANGATHKSEGCTKQSHVPEIEYSLEKPIHLCLEQEVIDVKIDIEGCRCSCQKASPSPKETATISVKKFTLAFDNNI